MIPLPIRPESANVQALASYTREEVTGLTTTALPVTHEISAGIEAVFKNGTLVRPSTYTLSGKIITLGSAAIAGDWFVVFYYARSTS